MMDTSVKDVYRSLLGKSVGDPDDKEWAAMNLNSLQHYISSLHHRILRHHQDVNRRARQLKKVKEYGFRRTK